MQSQNISDETRILTSDASKLTPENITSATKVVGQIFNITRNALPEVKLTQFLKRGGEGRKEERHSKLCLFRGMDLSVGRLLKTILQSTLAERCSKK